MKTMKIKLKEILSSINLKETIDNIVVVENKADMPELKPIEYSPNEYTDNIIIYKSEHVLIIKEHYHKHNYYRGEYIENYDYYKHIVYITVDFKFKISHILDNYHKDF
jgi:hypothetical protein